MALAFCPSSPSPLEEIALEWCLWHVRGSFKTGSRSLLRIGSGNINGVGKIDLPVCLSTMCSYAYLCMIALQKLCLPGNEEFTILWTVGRQENFPKMGLSWIPTFNQCNLKWSEMKWAELYSYKPRSNGAQNYIMLCVSAKIDNHNETSKAGVKTLSKVVHYEPVE